MTIAMNNYQQARRRRRAAPLALLAAVASAITLSIVIAGAPARAATGTWATETIAGMSVRIYTPATQGTLGVGRALMINLHGCLQKAQNLQDNGNWAATADRTGMIIALPDAPGGGVIAGCWDYYDSSHSSTAPTRHDDNLLDLATTMIGRTTLGIDRNQVYISGLSSGGGETMVMGCLFPRIFAGIGINAGPTVGTNSSQIGSVATTATTAASTCTNFAGSDSASFQTQLTSVIYGSNDATVAPGYDTLNGEVMANIYGASTKTTFSLSGLPGTNAQGSGTLYSDSNGGRVSVIQNTGLGHNWPAGSGSGGSYISPNSIDYPSYLASFFFANNRRVDRSGTPTPTPTTSPTPTPTATPSPTPTSTDCITATNLEHKNAGRATSYGINPYNPYYSAGLLGYMGQGDGTVSSLKRKTNGWTVASSCS